MMKIICVDFDGTLVTREDGIHPADMAILREGREGYLFIPSTGRPLHSVKRVFNNAGLFLDGPIPLPLVLQNGGITYTPGEEVCRFNTFPEDVQAEMVGKAGAMPGITFYFSGPDEFDLLHPHDGTEAYITKYHLKTIPYSSTVRNPYCKVMGVCHDRLLLEKYIQGISHLPVESVYSLPHVVEISIRGVNKGDSAKDLLAVMGYADSPVYVVGDGENDLPLFGIADRVFIPTDAPESIRVRGDEIIDREKEGVLMPLIRSFEEGNPA